MLCAENGAGSRAFLYKKALNLELFDSKREHKWIQPALIHERRIFEARVFLLEFIMDIFNTVPAPFFIPMVVTMEFRASGWVVEKGDPVPWR